MKEEQQQNYKLKIKWIELKLLSSGWSTRASVIIKRQRERERGVPERNLILCGLSSIFFVVFYVSSWLDWAGFPLLETLCEERWFSWVAAQYEFPIRMRKGIPNDAASTIRFKVHYKIRSSNAWTRQKLWHEMQKTVLISDAKRICSTTRLPHYSFAIEERESERAVHFLCFWYVCQEYIYCSYDHHQYY